MTNQIDPTIENQIEELPSVSEYYPDYILGDYPDPNDVPDFGHSRSAPPMDWKEHHIGVDIDDELLNSPKKYAVLDENNIVISVYVEIRKEESIQEQQDHYHFYKIHHVPHPKRDKFPYNPEYDPERRKILITNEIKGSPAVGNTYDEENNRFISPCPVDGYVLCEDTCTWIPEEGKEYDLHGDGIMYTYNKELKVWDLVHNAVE